MEALALYTFRATEGDELSFNKGDLLKVDFVSVKAIAMVLKELSQSQLNHWFAGRISRGVAESRLRHRECGAFLARESESAPGEFSLSVSYGDHVQHFKVLQDRSNQYYVWDELFSSLNELVEFYHSNSIAKERNVFLRDPEHFARRPHHAHALFDFSPHHPSQLRFLRGDVIELIDCSDSVRWRGRCHGHVGYFPPEYVQPIFHCQ
ncbi:hypothetical protein F2P81_014814 [Scophthalmus maximus]|uniref:GRB2-related adapter protein-like n=1 Tax=Scophthalmus maximus TaxID=52904 RepID=A0A6A4SN57_SCOMX|nr:hypothetical protein F2P81_014814 [Scophthalmus maximus]